MGQNTALIILFVFIVGISIIGAIPGLRNKMTAVLGRWKPGFRPVAELVYHGRRGVYGICFSGSQRMGLFQGRAGLLHPGLRRPGIHGGLSYSAQNLYIRT